MAEIRDVKMGVSKGVEGRGGNGSCILISVWEGER
jgi:hypothetical protein